MCSSDLLIPLFCLFFLTFLCLVCVVSRKLETSDSRSDSDSDSGSGSKSVFGPWRVVVILIGMVCGVHHCCY